MFGCVFVVVVVVVAAVVFHLWNLKVWKLYCLLDLFFFVLLYSNFIHQSSCHQHTAD